MNAIVKLPAAVTSKAPAPHLTERYVHIDTTKVIRVLGEEGFTVAGVRQDSSRTRDPRFVRHEVDFRHPELSASKPAARQVGDVEPRILFVNSHNGTVRARFILGLFRLVCTNGMVVGSPWANTNNAVLHIGDEARNIIDRIREASKGTGAMFAEVERMQRKQLTRAQQLDFARRAAELRFGAGAADRYPPETLLGLRRAEDEGDSLWRVLNRVQENGTKPGLQGMSATGRVVTSRGIAGIAHDHKWNAELWRLAAELVA